MDLITDISKRFEAKYQQCHTPWIGDTVPQAIVSFGELVRSENKNTILDLGCGDGWIAVYLAQQGLIVTGVDSSETAIDHARQNAVRADVQNKARFICQDALSFKSEKKFDAMVDRGLLHHIPEENWSAYYRATSENIKPGGWFYLGVFSDKLGKKGFLPKRDGKMWDKVKDDTGYWTYDHFFNADLISEMFGDDWKIEQCVEDQQIMPNGSRLLNCVLRRR